MNPASHWYCSARSPVPPTPSVLLTFFFEHASVLFVNYSTGSLSPPTTPHSARPRNTVHFHTGRGREAETENRREVREDSSKEKRKTKERMAAVAATVTAALSSCSKRGSDIVGAGMSVFPPRLFFFFASSQEWTAT
jgi:hypothetical protein